jgi:PadR family transcriptional regulator, regulatory protein PadR
MGREKQDFLKGTLDMLILKIVALGPIHGYAIALRVEQISDDVFQLQQGSLYPALHKLEKDKLLAAEWKQTDTGREAKFCRDCLNAKSGRSTRCYKKLNSAAKLIQRTTSEAPQRHMCSRIHR